MKILTVVGARPQFIKAAAVSRKLRQKHTELLVHTGQHYDKNMSDVFFDELSIPHPEFNLGAGSGTHAEQTAAMLVGIEKLLISEKPDYLMTYGDTNSTLAGALAASKLHIPVVHIEAGLRSYNMIMPEEQNRVLCDHISTLLFCPTQTAVDNLKKESIEKGVYNVGDVMCDAVLYYSANMDSVSRESRFAALKSLLGDIKTPDSWYLATVHRAENTDGEEKVSGILEAFEEFDAPVIFPVHPRTKPMVAELNKRNHYKNIIFVEPLGYLDMLFFTKNAKKVVTDSGGLQKEAYILGTPSVTVRPQTEWVETLGGNRNILAEPTKTSILHAAFETEVSSEVKQLYGDGHAADKIIEILSRFS